MPLVMVNLVKGLRANMKMLCTVIGRLAKSRDTSRKICRKRILTSVWVRMQRVLLNIYQKFYSDEAKFRNAPKRIELARLTNRQYRESVSDLFVNLLKTNDLDGGGRHEIGLKASYYDSKGMNKKDNLKKESH